MNDGVPRGTLGTVHNASLLLDLLSSGPSHHALTDLAERSDMSLPTVHRLLRSLVAAGLVEQDPSSSRYGLGHELVRLAEHYLARSSVLKAAGPYLVELRNSTRATVVLAILVGDEAVYIDRIDGDDAGGVYRDGSRIRPPLSCAAGRLLLAHADDGTWNRVAGDDVEQGLRDKWRTSDTLLFVPDPPIGQAEIAAPVRDAEGNIRAAVAVIDYTAAPDGERLERDVAPQLTRTANAISRTPGHG